MAYGVDVEAHTFDALIAGQFPLVTQGVTLEMGQNLERGALLGKVTASGKWKLSESAAGDGSENPRAILVEDCDATAADEACLIYLTGEFNKEKVIFGTGHTAESVWDTLASFCIFLKETLAAD